MADVAERTVANREIVVTYKDGTVKTYQVDALVEYRAALTDPGHGMNPLTLGWHQAWHAAGAPEDDIEEWVATISDFNVRIAEVDPT